MVFKEIKYVDNLAAGYEMNQECTRIRKAGVEIPIDAEKIELMSTAGTKKLFGVRTLYWSSWNKPTERFPSKKKNTEVKPTVAKKLPNSIHFGEKQLLSGFLSTRLRQLIEKRAEYKGTASGQEIDDGKSFSIRVLLHNTEKQLLLVRIYSQNWRDGIWFLNPNSGKYISFIKAEHKPTYGNSAVLWPVEL